MSEKNKHRGTRWQHPIPVSLLRQHNYQRQLAEIIDAASASLLASLKDENSSLFSKEDIATPVESIASVLNVEVVLSRRQSSFSASTEQSGTKYQVVQHTWGSHYFRQRFSLAHELGHIILSRIAGPFSFEELSKTKHTGYEEEALCDLFASALLIPKTTVEPYLKESNNITSATINRIAKDFRVSRAVALRRIAWLTDSILLLWNDIANPLKKDSKKEERVTQVYPNLSQLSGYYVPLYCTPNDLRFTPNIVLESYMKGISTHGIVEIKDLGSLPIRPYRLHNVFFQRWSDNLISAGLVEHPKRFFNMATFIEMQRLELEEKERTPYQLTLFD